MRELCSSHRCQLPMFLVCVILDQWSNTSFEVHKICLCEMFTHSSLRLSFTIVAQTHVFIFAHFFPILIIHYMVTLSHSSYTHTQRKCVCVCVILAFHTHTQAHTWQQFQHVNSIMFLSFFWLIDCIDQLMPWLQAFYKLYNRCQCRYLSIHPKNFNTFPMLIYIVYKILWKRWSTNLFRCIHGIHGQTYTDTHAIFWRSYTHTHWFLYG